MLILTDKGLRMNGVTRNETRREVVEHGQPMENGRERVDEGGWSGQRAMWSTQDDGSTKY